VVFRCDTGYVGDPFPLEWHPKAEQDAFLHFKWHQMLLSRVDNWSLTGEAIAPACFRHLFLYGLGKAASLHGVRGLMSMPGKTHFQWFKLDKVILTLPSVLFHVSSSRS